MRINFLLILVVCSLGGCAEVWQNETPVRAVVSSSIPMMAGQWQARVEEDVAKWRAIMPAGCTVPFKLDQNNPQARPIILLPPWEWDEPAAIGIFFGDSIQIKSLDDGTLGSYWHGGDNWNLLKHELGHALGLEHANPKYGPSVLLSPVTVDIQPRDVEAAACVLGCGPCNGPDPYDIP